MRQRDSDVLTGQGQKRGQGKSQSAWLLSVGEPLTLGTLLQWGIFLNDEVLSSSLHIFSSTTEFVMPGISHTKLLRKSAAQKVRPY